MSAYLRESFDHSLLGLACVAFSLFTLGLMLSGPILGGIIVTSAAIVRELAVNWIGQNR